MTQIEEGINPPPNESGVDEARFWQRAIDRLETEHHDLPDKEHWLELLNDDCDGDRVLAAKCRVMAAIAVCSMMDVIDSRKIADSEIT